MTPATKQIIEKWYKKLKFPQKYDEQFHYILQNEAIDENASWASYDMNEKNGRKNFLMSLYSLEELEKQYIKKGIPDAVFMDTARDFVRWTEIWSNIRGELWLEELPWLNMHLSFRLFKLGRLQFCMWQFDEDFDSLCIKKGETALGVHIPSEGPLEPEKCAESFKYANVFFEKYFPEFRYRFFMCHSWLLDDTLKKYQKPDSNILKFQGLFTPIQREESYDLLKYIFEWNAQKKDIEKLKPKSQFAEKIKSAVEGGETFYNVLGIINKDEYASIYSTS